MDDLKVTCWVDRNCGCEPGGACAVGRAPCPAAVDTTCDGLNDGVNAGRICWEVEGTPCAPGTVEEKRATCQACAFFRRVKYEQGGHFQPIKPGRGLRDPRDLHRLLNDTVALTSVCRDILGHLALRPLLERVAQSARQVTRATAAAVYLRADRGAPALESESIAPLSRRVGSGSGRAMWRLEAAAGPFDGADRLDGDDDDAAAEAARTRLPCRRPRNGGTVLALPLAGDVEPAGILALVKAAGPFTASDEWFLREIALMAGLGLQNARTVENLREARDLNKAKSRFVALVMHQIGSPLATVACSLQALAQLGDRLEPDDRDQLIATSLDRIAGIQDLKRKLLDLAAIRSGHHLAARRTVSLAEALRLEVEAASLRARQEGLELVAAIPAFPAPVHADPDGLRLIFANLIDNAIKYSAGCGRTVQVRLTTGDGRVRVAVQDQGIGIPAEERARLFEEFHRAGNAAASKASGSGLGLAFVNELVTRYGGRIDVESEVGRGATFAVTFPLREESDGLDRSQ